MPQAERRNTVGVTQRYDNLTQEFILEIFILSQNHPMVADKNK